MNLNNGETTRLFCWITKDATNWIIYSLRLCFEKPFFETISFDFTMKCATEPCLGLYRCTNKISFKLPHNSYTISLIVFYHICFFFAVLVSKICENLFCWFILFELISFRHFIHGSLIHWTECVSCVNKSNLNPKSIKFLFTHASFLFFGATIGKGVKWSIFLIGFS